MKPLQYLFQLILIVIFFTSFTKLKYSFLHQSHIEQIPKDKYSIVIDKSDYELNVYDSAGLYASYPVVFGSEDQSDKMFEGDKKTPNGNFIILSKTVHQKWGPELVLNYPTKENIKTFNKRKSQGLIPQKASIGCGIAIHGTRPQEEWTVDQHYNWTNGCVSLKYSDMKKLYSYIPSGTKVTIRP